MGNIHKIRVEITFLSEEEGGRKKPPLKLSSRKYRPHLVVGDLSQREAIIVKEEVEVNGRTIFMNVIKEEYLSVTFSSGPETTDPGQTISCELELLLDHISLIPGKTFTIREGSKIVGFGRVISRWKEETFVQ